MLLQTNSYIVPKEKRSEHSRLILRFKQTLARLGCEHFEAYEQVGSNWSPAEATGRFVQIMRFRDKKHQLQVQAAERTDTAAQALIKEFCELINFPYQQQQGLFAVGFYSSILPHTITRIAPPPPKLALPPARMPPTPHPVPMPVAEPELPAEAHDIPPVDEPLPMAEEAVQHDEPLASEESAPAPEAPTEETKPEFDPDLVLGLDDFEPPSDEEDDTASPDRAMRH